MSKTNAGLWPSWAIVSLQQTIPVLQHGAHSEYLRALRKPFRSCACLRSIKVPNTSFNFVNKPSVRLLNAGFSFSRASALLIIYQKTFVVLFVIELYWPGGSTCTSLRGIVRRSPQCLGPQPDFEKFLRSQIILMDICLLRKNVLLCRVIPFLSFSRGLKLVIKVIDFSRVCLSHVHQTQLNGCFILSSFVGRICLKPWL